MDVAERNGDYDEKNLFCNRYALLYKLLPYVPHTGNRILQEWINALVYPAASCPASLYCFFLCDSKVKYSKRILKKENDSLVAGRVLCDMLWFSFRVPDWK